MPLQSPSIDRRKFQELVTDVRARIPVHTPEYTNFNQSDPGQTLIDVFGFLAESLLYRLNRYPDNNRLKFLQLLGQPLQQASAAMGMVAFTNDRGPLEALTLDDGTQVQAGRIPFLVERGLDVLPVSTLMVCKQPTLTATDSVRDYYNQLYASFRGTPPAINSLSLYTAQAFDPAKGLPVDLTQTVDNSLWIALLARTPELVDATRDALAGKTLSIGIVPALADAQRTLAPKSQGATATGNLLTVEIPQLPEPSGLLPLDPSLRIAQYRPLTVSSTSDVLTEPGIMNVVLPPAPQLKLWGDLDPLEVGTGNFPPSIQDTAANDLLVTWLRIRLARGTKALIYYAGINNAMVQQREHILNELLPTASGQPDQTYLLANAPVLAQSVKITVAPQNGAPEAWSPIDDLSAAGPEVPVPDSSVPPGAVAPPPSNPKVFSVTAESGQVAFGDGLRGARPSLNSVLRAEYDFSAGRAGNVGAGAINAGPNLPGGVKVANPIPSWGGADAETVTEGEKQIPRYLQNRDRLVTKEDFETIARRTPGVEIARIEVIPTYNPQLASSEPGDTPGTVTLMLIPKNDPDQPDAPRPDELFLDTICRYLDPRRLVTTELFLRGPKYVDIWISAGVKVAAGYSSAVVRESVAQSVRAFLAPFTDAAATLPDMPPVLLTQPQPSTSQNGWPLRKSVLRLELEAVVSRVAGVELVNGLFVAKGADSALDEIPFAGLELPRLRGISVVDGDPVDLDTLRGNGTAPATGTGSTVPVPFIPQECS